MAGEVSCRSCLPFFKTSCLPTSSVRHDDSFGLGQYDMTQQDLIEYPAIALSSHEATIKLFMSASDMHHVLPAYLPSLTLNH